VQAAFIEAACRRGLPYVADHNRPGAMGVEPTPRNASEGVRMSTALTYLASARGRPNLTVRGGAVADRVEVHGGAATGVRLAGSEVVAADRAVLAAGAYASPAILQRSGVGPDLHLFAAGPFDASRNTSPSSAIFGLVTGLVLSLSRGWVRLRSADPADPPRINVAHLGHPDDMRRMIEATLIARAISRTAPLAGLVEGDELTPGPPISDDDTDAIATSIASRVDTYHHPVGTCRMGPDPAPGQSSMPAGACMASSACTSPTHPSCRQSPQPAPTCPPS
jgi:choline dehydrogenase